MSILGKGGLLLLSMGGCSGILMYLSLERPAGWAYIRNFARLRQGHVDALVLGGIFLAAEATGVVDPYASLVLLITGFYTVISTGAMGWWPDFPQRYKVAGVGDFAALSTFALAWVWVTVRVLTGW
ncbi:MULTISPECIES: hypothetical protein [unclassified Mesorhizobium]|uniref:hypothetical protein n=1 Tax=unclassified Mesorhizobium TaxID=325217 RepID=UPI000FCCD978|nr:MULTISPECIES: hypothetical protein [unclassified Mesorhizobium]RUW24976.1 hypothetical protein EOA34_13250 [Mesorhizobium sp. M4B.F.Ca.ET.013.02.1.1]RUW68967.1 hypothetical protein EOA31_24480 [Mesorhizobium sp. M4B.F.Ca.ET.049.02.1.2]RVD31166.1 hypothetical protein EN738_02970 [Mesorhizobium sp. M4B.F.Ca.ET.017.02.2.1]RVD36199.1 hypothetical protein EN741_26225 [Mesorhizobium sp. M4B.F.Ca.ET.019.03.1.1]RWX66934.1 hypothetical protein EN780_13665 [Mesorhizobium sp. M4B.F.Ca.ET.089.01.1.1]